jgi:hypothetical protein
MCCSDVVLIGLAGGVFSLVMRLCFPFTWKYKLRHNFFAMLNCVMGLFGWILCSFNTAMVGNSIMIIAFLLGSGLLADIYLPKPKLANHYKRS